MPYYSAFQDDDFEEYSPDPYAGGYDIYREYGEPLDHSDDTCHLMKMSFNEDIDYDRPDFSYSHVHSNAYSPEALDAEYSSYGPRPPQIGSQQAEPDYGANGQDQYPEEYGRPEGGYGRPPESEFESGFDKYGEQAEYPAPEEFGSPYGRKQAYGGTDTAEFENPDEEYGRRQQYGRRHEYGDVDAGEYGNPDEEYGRRHECGDVNAGDYGNPNEEYGRRHEYGDADAGDYGNRNEYGDPVEYDEGYGMKQEYGDADTAEYGRVYGRKHESYGENEDAGYEFYGRNNDEEEERPRRHRGYAEE